MRSEPSQEDAEALILLAQRDDLSEWEEGFLASLEEAEEWTERQHLVFNELFERKMKG